jgi:hypothetical protein
LKYSWIAAAGLCAFIMAGVSAARPQMNWDMLAYVALVRGWEGATPAQAHADAYADAKRLADARGVPERYDALVTGEHRAVVARDAGVFGEQMPFYRSRPLYLAVVAAAGMICSTLSGATVFVSVASVLGFGLALLWFAVRRLGAVEGSILAILFILAPTTTDAAGSSSPDGLATLMAGGAAMLLVRGRLWAAAGVLACGVLVRTDLAIFNVCLGGAWLLIAGWQRAWKFAAAMGGSLLLAKGVDLMAGGYGYLALYHYTFIEAYVSHPADLRGLPIPPGVFVGNLARGVRYSLENGGLWILLAMMGLAGMLVRRGPPAGGATVALLVAVGCQTAIRFLLFPEIDLRFDTPGIAVLAVVLAEAGSGRRVATGA